MPRQEIVDRFVATVVDGDFVGAIERFYTSGASMRENQDAPRVGRDGLVRHEQGIMSMFQSVACESVGRPLIAGDQVAIQWRFVITLPGGETRTLQEVAWQRWDGDQIAEETFFYDPKQIAPPAA
jgi:SnoaL-like domain